MLQRDTERVLESSLADPVISRSPHQSTGNAYQTIRLGGSVRGGFRTDRLNLLSGFDVAGRSACDLGANLGEIPRDLHRAGASHVDACEYDHFFTQLARYLTAYNGLPDINHLQADVAHEGFMRGQYDVCVGLAAYSYMQKNIDYICRQVRDLMIIETHEVRASAGMPGTFSGSSRTLLTGTAASTAPSCSLAEAGELLDRLALGG